MLWSLQFQERELGHIMLAIRHLFFSPEGTMNSKLLYAVAVGVTLISAVTIANAGTKRIDLMGDGAQPAAADRTIVITPGTTSVHVEGGEVVKFVAGDKSFTWRFSGPATVDAIDLSQIAPQGFLDRKVKAYIDPDTRYTLN